jgi:hypothetical protein
MHPAHNLIRTPARAIVSALGFNRHLRAADVEAVAANADSQAGNACAAFESRRGLWRVKADRVDALACQGFGAEIFHAAAFARIAWRSMSSSDTCPSVSAAMAGINGKGTPSSRHNETAVFDRSSFSASHVALPLLAGRSSHVCRSIAVV